MSSVVRKPLFRGVLFWKVSSGGRCSLLGGVPWRELSSSGRCPSVCLETSYTVRTVLSSKSLQQFRWLRSLLQTLSAWLVCNEWMKPQPYHAIQLMPHPQWNISPNGCHCTGLFITAIPWEWSKSVEQEVRDATLSSLVSCLQHYMEDVEEVDSLVFNCHKPACDLHTKQRYVLQSGFKQVVLINNNIRFN